MDNAIESPQKRRQVACFAGGALLLIGVAERVLWCFMTTAPGATGEAFNVARAIASGRGFADAYAIGQGPTAHLLPASPAIAGSVYWLFGINSIASESILAFWALSLVFTAYVLLFRAFAQLGTPRWARLVSFGFLCITPIYIAQEAIDFRIWEGGLAVALMALLLYKIAQAESTCHVANRDVIHLSLIGAVLFFINPALGLGCYGCLFVLGLRRLTTRQRLSGVAITLAALASLIGPWAARNYQQLGSPVLLRSNAGLELALANHPRAAAALAPPGQVFLERLRNIHPAQGAVPLARVRQVGEVLYSKQLGADASHWMFENPLSAVMLAGRHIRQTLAPEPWQFTTFGSGKWSRLRSALASLVGLIGCARLLLFKRAIWIYPTLMVVIPALALSPFQPVPRYTYLFYPILVYCAGDLLSQIILKFRLLEQSDYRPS